MNIYYNLFCPRTFYSLHSCDMSWEVLLQWRSSQRRAINQGQCQTSRELERCFVSATQGFYDAPEHSHMPLEGGKNVTIPEYVVFKEKKKNYMHQGSTTWSSMHGSLLVPIMQWHKILHAQSKKQGEESLPWIQNQILWDWLEFSNKHLQTLLIQYSIWHIWIKPTLPSCFPTRCLGEQKSTGEAPTKSWHFSKLAGAC